MLHEVLEAAMAAGTGQDGVVDAIHRLTERSVCAEDRFGNLLAWSGHGRPHRYPKPKTSQRERFLRTLTTKPDPVRVGDRVCVLIQPHAEILGVVALIAPDGEVVGGGSAVRPPVRQSACWDSNCPIDGASPRSN